MAYDLVGVRTKALSRVRDIFFDTTDANNFINDTINDIYNEYQLSFMQTSQTYTLTTGVSDITDGSELPTNFVKAINLTVTTAGKEAVLPYQEVSEIDEYYPDADDEVAHPRGAPQYWYKYGETIRVFPEPDAAYTLTLRYWKRPTILTSDTAVPDIPSEFEEILVVGAGYRVLQVKENYDQATIYQNKYDELLDKLVTRYSGNQTGRPHIMRINRRTSYTRNIDSYRRI